MLILDNYNSGPAAPYKSWVLIEKTNAGLEEHSIGVSVTELVSNY